MLTKDFQLGKTPTFCYDVIDWRLNPFYQRTDREISTYSTYNRCNCEALWICWNFKIWCHKGPTYWSHFTANNNCKLHLCTNHYAFMDEVPQGANRDYKWVIKSIQWSPIFTRNACKCNEKATSTLIHTYCSFICPWLSIAQVELLESIVSGHTCQQLDCMRWDHYDRRDKRYHHHFVYLFWNIFCLIEKSKDKLKQKFSKSSDKSMVGLSVKHL